MARPSAARAVIWRAVVLAALAGCAAGRPVEVSTATRTPGTVATLEPSATPLSVPQLPSSPSTTVTTVVRDNADARIQTASRRRPPTTTTTAGGTSTTVTTAAPTTTTTRPPEPATTTTSTTRPAGDGTVVDMAVTPDGTGAWLLSADGTVRAVGTASHLGDRSGRLSAPAVEISATRSGRGYFVTTAAGEVFVFGDAVHAGNLPAGYEVSGMVPDPDGYGYWMVTPEGYFMTFEENFYAPSPGPPNRRDTPIVAVATDPTHSGWGNETGWAPVTAGGEVLAYGSWGGFGEPRPEEVLAPIVDIAATPTGKGWTLVDRAGHVYPYGDARSYGDAHARSTAPVVSITITPTNRGYWITAADGAVFSFGDAVDFGDSATRP